MQKLRQISQMAAKVHANATRRHGGNGADGEAAKQARGTAQGVVEKGGGGASLAWASHLVGIGACAREAGDLVKDGHEQVGGVVGHLALRGHDGAATNTKTP